MRLLALVLVALVLALSACLGDDDGPSPTGSFTEEMRFTRGGNEAILFVEVADDGGERNTGLMGRTSLPRDAGMLFVYPEDTTTGFWMKDTEIPLSIAFISAGGSIIDIQDMEPLSEETHSSPQPFRFAVEVNQGWFEDNDVRVGDLAQLPVGVGF